MTNEKLILARKAKKITQADIAIYLKISQTQYNKREKGKIKITDNEWQLIAKLLSVSLEEIYEDYKVQTPQNPLILIQDIDFLKEKIKLLESKRFLL